MKTLTFHTSHHLDKIHDELLAAVPSVQPSETNGERRAVMTVSGDGQALTLRVPDTADQAAIRAVVEAHDPTPPPPPPDPQVELGQAIEAVDTSQIQDPAARAAIEALKAAMLGTRPGSRARVEARPTGGPNGA